MEIRIVYTIFVGFLVLTLITVAGLTLLSYGTARSDRTIPMTEQAEGESIEIDNNLQEIAVVDSTDDNPEQPEVLGAASNQPNPQEFTNSLYSLINAYRKEQGVGTLQQHNALIISAQAKLADMQQKKYWSHISPEGTHPWDFFVTAGYDYHYAGENLAFSHNTPWDVFTHWQESELHRLELIKPEYNHFGAAVDCQYQSGTERSCITVLHLGKHR